MLSELLAHTSDILQVPKENIHGWCDSTIALSWLRSCPSRYHTFVANRVASAARNVQPSVWLHIPTDQNPADCASRGLSATELKDHHLWWEGPPWLLLKPEFVPPQPKAIEIEKAQQAHTASMFYVVGAKQLARVVCKDCLICKKRAPRALSQMMGQLPAPRVNRAMCFIHTGVDYAGPIKLKRGNPRKPTITKAYLSIFVCLATKAIHIEVVSSASTEALIAALERFLDIRGLPKHIYSDHGANFVGARHELKDLYDFLSLPATDKVIKEHLLKKKVSWHHIPEKSPHFGRIWESAVKSAKYHLKRTVGTVKLDFEEMVTVTCQISACLNSRPYVAQDSHDSEGEMPLTPGHFLIGRPIQSYPEEPVEPDLSLTDRWKLCQSIVQLFWDKWSSSYLHSLQAAKKWHKTLPNVKVGDLVMVLEETPLMTKWKMGRVVETFPGADGLVRAAQVDVPTTIMPDYYSKTNRKLQPEDIKVKISSFRRAITKLAPLMSISAPDPT